MSQKFTEMEILSAWCEVSRGRVKHIPESVRTRILKFALDVCNAFPEALNSPLKMSASASAFRKESDRHTNRQIAG